MFRPETSPVSRDELLEADADWAYSHPDRQAVHNSALKLIPLYGPDQPVQIGWPLIDWNLQDSLPQTPGEIGTRWTPTFNNVAITTPQLFEFGTVSRRLDIHCESGEHQYFRQESGGTYTYWPDHVNNTTGWTIEFEMQVLASDTGADLYPELLIDDGAHRERVRFLSDEIRFQYSPELNLSVDLTVPRKIRLGGIGDDLYIGLDDGRGYVGADYYTGASEGAELMFGVTGTSHETRTQWNYINQFHGGVWVDGQSSFSKVYTTDGSTAVSPAYAPNQHVRSWTAAYAETSGVLSGSTTIHVEYRSNVTSNAWTPYNSYLVDTIGQFEIDLTSMPTAGDGSDEVRFKITQVSVDGINEPPRVETITVLAVFNDKGLRIHPVWGHKDGGNTVVMEIDPQSAYYIGRESMDKEVALAPALPGQTPVTRSTLEQRLIQIPCNGDMDDDITGITAGVDAGVAYRTSNHDRAAVMGTFSHASSNWDNALATYSLDPIYGGVCTGCTPIHADTGDLNFGSSNISLPGYASTPSQTVGASDTGDGVSIWGTATTGDSLTMQLLVGRGAVRVTHGNQYHDFHSHDYRQSWPVTFQTDPTYFGEVTMTALEPDTKWRWALPYTLTPDQPSAALTGCAHAETGEGFGAEARVTSYEFGTDIPLVSRMNSNSGWEIGVTNGGFPYAKIGDGSNTDTVRGEWPVKIGEEKHLALNYRPFGDHTRLQVLVNGQVCGEKTTTLTTVDNATSDVLTVGGSSIIQVDEIAAHSKAYDPAKLSVHRGFQHALFQVETDVPQEAENKLILRFDRYAGAIADGSGNDSHVYQPLDGRSGLYRNISIAGRRSARFWNDPRTQAAARVLHVPDFVQTLPQSLYVKGEWWNYSQTQVIYSKWNLAGTVGWQVQVDPGGLVTVFTKDGFNTRTLTSTAYLATRLLTTLGVSITTTGITIKIDGTTDTLSESIGTLSAATEDAEIGRGCTCYIDTLVLRAGALDDFDDWRDPTATKWTSAEITDRVFIDNVEVPPARISHYSPTRKYVRMPAGDPGFAPVYVLSEVSSPGVAVVSERPYRYTYGYLREAPASMFDDTVFRTKSPFKVTVGVPKNSIGAAYIQGPDLAVPRNISLTRLEYLTSENLSTYFGGLFMATQGTLSGNVTTYTSQIDTEDVRISNRSMLRRTLKEPTPLFYKYLVGRKRYYVYNVNALTVDDIGLVRAGIRVTDVDGGAVTSKDYPWEIEVSRTDVNGNELPNNIFAVTLFTGKSHLSNKTVWVTYEAADSLQRWAVIPNFREAINPESIFRRVYREADIGRDDYMLVLEDDGTYTLKIWNGS